MAPSKPRWLSWRNHRHGDKKANKAENRTKASSSNVAQSQVPPPVPPETQSTQAGENQAAKESYLRKESAVQETPSLPTSQRLWNEAYDSLKNDTDTSELVKGYVKTLVKCLRDEKTRDNSASGADDVSVELEDPTKRQIYMKKLVEEGQTKVSTVSKITKGLGDVSEFILSAKDLIGSAIQNIPQAAIPWAGVCVGLQILLNPAKATKSNLAGIAYVVSRMDWYCGLSEYLLNKDNIVVGGKSFEAILQQLEKTAIALYKALLLYQMKSVCSYYRNQGLIFLRSLANLDDWDGDLKNITDAEVVLQNDSHQYNNQYAKSCLGRLVKLAEIMEAQLGDVRQTLRDFIDQQKKIHRDDKDSECLRALRVVDPQYDMMEIEGKKDALLDDAYRWVLDTNEYAAFTNWSDDEPDQSPCRLLWIKGPAGTGKTMLLIGIIRELSNRPFMLTPKLSYFFCQGANTTLNNATAILRSLIWMLLVQQPYLISHLQEAYKVSGPPLFTEKAAFYTLSAIFQDMLKDARLSSVYFIVDALDECDQAEPGLERLVNLISMSLTFSDKVKWLVSSRPEVDLKPKLKNSDALGDLLELDAQKLEAPVKAYISHKLTTLRAKDGYDEGVLAEVSKVVYERAMNTFLWVSLVFEELHSVEGWYAVKIIEQIPPGLSKLYEHMMTRIEKGKMSDPKYCKNVLVAASLAYRPLTLSELAIAAGLPSKITPETIVKKCGLFFTTKKKTVYLIHQSAKDYLEANSMSGLQQGGAVQGHADISRCLLSAMSKLRKNIYAQLHVGSKSEDITVPSPDPLEGLRYPCVYWARHVCQVGLQLDPQRNGAQLYDQVYQFLQEHFLHWLEALGWIGKSSEGILAIFSLEALYPATKTPDLYAFIQDAKRFALYNRSLIERVPLQLYCSALVFAPENSIIGRQFKEDIPLWIQRKPKVQVNWNAVLQTLEGHSNSINSVAFSPDGKLIVSGSYDNTVRLWDTATGAALQILKGHSSSVDSVTFSSDGKLVVSGSYKIVRLWDTATGGALQTLEGHSGSVYSVALSPDGKLVVSGSYDKTVRIWDTMTGVALQTLEGHSGSVDSVAFSPDGKLVVSGSDDKTVRLWDTATGAVLQTLKGHSGFVRSVAFSPDGKLVVSGSDDGTVRLWDTATGAVLQTLEANPDWVKSVAFSPDGKVEQTLFVSNDWVVEEKEKILWLPPDYRATSMAIWNRLIVLGHSSGRISFLGFKEGSKLM